MERSDTGPEVPASGFTDAGPGFDDSYEEARRAFQEGSFEDSLAAAQRAIKADPARADGHYAAAMSLLRLDRIDEAEASFVNALDRGASDTSLMDAYETNVRYFLGSIAEERSEWPVAAEHYSRVVSLDSSTAATDRLRALVDEGRVAVDQLAPEVRDLLGLHPPRPASAPEQQTPEFRAPRSLAEALQAEDHAEGAATIDERERAGRGDLLWEGRRRITSFGKQLSGAVGLFLLALLVPRLLEWIADQAKKGPRDDGAKATLADIMNAAQAPVMVLLLLAAIALLAYVVAAAAVTRYRIYERRIDMQKGVFFRRQSSLWLYDVTDIDYERTPYLLLANTGCIALQSEGTKVAPDLAQGRRRQGGSVNTDRIVGIADHGEMLQLAERLRAIALRERRSMKQTFI